MVLVSDGCVGSAPTCHTLWIEQLEQLEQLSEKSLGGAEESTLIPRMGNERAAKRAESSVGLAGGSRLPGPGGLPVVAHQNMCGA